MLEQKLQDENIDRRDFIKRVGIIGGALALSSLINSCVKLEFYPYEGRNGYRFKEDINANDDLYFCKEYVGFDHLPLKMPHAWWLEKNSDFKILTPGGIGNTYSMINVDKGAYLEWNFGILRYITTFKGWTGKLEPVGLKMHDDKELVRSIYPNAKIGHSYASDDEIWSVTTDFTDYEGKEYKTSEYSYGAGLLVKFDKNNKIKYLQVELQPSNTDDGHFYILPEEYLEKLPK